MVNPNPDDLLGAIVPKGKKPVNSDRNWGTKMKKGHGRGRIQKVGMLSAAATGFTDNIFASQTGGKQASNRRPSRHPWKESSSRSPRHGAQTSFQVGQQRGPMIGGPQFGGTSEHSGPYKTVPQTAPELMAVTPQASKQSSKRGIFGLEVQSNSFKTMHGTSTKPGRLVVSEKQKSEKMWAGLKQNMQQETTINTMKKGRGGGGRLPNLRAADQEEKAHTELPQRIGATHGQRNVNSMGFPSLRKKSHLQATYNNTMGLGRYPAGTKPLRKGVINMDIPDTAMRTPTYTGGFAVVTSGKKGKDTKRVKEYHQHLEPTMGDHSRHDQLRPSTPVHTDRSGKPERIHSARSVRSVRSVRSARSARSMRSVRTELSVGDASDESEEELEEKDSLLAGKKLELLNFDDKLKLTPCPSKSMHSHIHLPEKTADTFLAQRQLKIEMARPLFHCGKCLDYWVKSGIARRFCCEPENRVQGPEMPLSEIPEGLESKRTRFCTPPPSHAANVLSRSQSLSMAVASPREHTDRDRWRSATDLPDGLLSRAADHPIPDSARSHSRAGSSRAHHTQSADDTEGFECRRQSQPLRRVSVGEDEHLDYGRRSSTEYGRRDSSGRVSPVVEQRYLQRGSRRDSAEQAKKRMSQGSRKNMFEYQWRSFDADDREHRGMGQSLGTLPFIESHVMDEVKDQDEETGEGQEEVKEEEKEEKVEPAEETEGEVEIDYEFGCGEEKDEFGWLKKDEQEEQEREKTPVVEEVPEKESGELEKADFVPSLHRVDSYELALRASKTGDESEEEMRERVFIWDDEGDEEEEEQEPIEEWMSSEGEAASKKDSKVRWSVDTKEIPEVVTDEGNAAEEEDAKKGKGDDTKLKVSAEGRKGAKSAKGARDKKSNPVKLSEPEVAKFKRQSLAPVSKLTKPDAKKPKLDESQKKPKVDESQKKPKVDESQKKPKVEEPQKKKKRVKKVKKDDEEESEDEEEEESFDEFDEAEYIRRLKRRMNVSSAEERRNRLKMKLQLEKDQFETLHQFKSSKRDFTFGIDEPEESLEDADKEKPGEDAKESAEQEGAEVEKGAEVKQEQDETKEETLSDGEAAEAPAVLPARKGSKLTKSALLEERAAIRLAKAGSIQESEAGAPTDPGSTEEHDGEGPEGSKDGQPAKKGARKPLKKKKTEAARVKRPTRVRKNSGFEKKEHDSAQSLLGELNPEMDEIQGDGTAEGDQTVATAGSTIQMQEGEGESSEEDLEPHLSGQAEDNSLSFVRVEDSFDDYDPLNEPFGYMTPPPIPPLPTPPLPSILAGSGMINRVPSLPSLPPREPPKRRRPKRFAIKRLITLEPSESMVEVMRQREAMKKEMEQMEIQLQQELQQKLLEQQLEADKKPLLAPIKPEPEEIKHGPSAKSKPSAPKLEAKSQLVIPDDDLSILSFTPSFTFTFYTLAPGYKERQETIQRNKPPVKVGPQKIPEMKRSEPPKEATNISKMAERMSTNLAKKRSIVSYVKKVPREKAKEAETEGSNRGKDTKSPMPDGSGDSNSNGTPEDEEAERIIVATNADSVVIQLKN